jgi:hypothetical protein
MASTCLTLSDRGREIQKLTEKARTIVGSNPMCPASADALELLAQAIESMVTNSEPLWTTEDA